MLTQTSRKTAFALTVVAAVSTPASLTSSLANAADANRFAACAKLTGTAKALCAVNELDKRIAAEKKKRAAAIRAGEKAERGIEAANREAAAARREAAASRKRYEATKNINACWEYLIDGVKSGLFRKQDVYDSAGGKSELRQGNMPCVVAKKLGFGEKAQAQP